MVTGENTARDELDGPATFASSGLATLSFVFAIHVSRFEGITCPPTPSSSPSRNAGHLADANRMVREMRREGRVVPAVREVAVAAARRPAGEPRRFHKHYRYRQHLGDRPQNSACTRTTSLFAAIASLKSYGEHFRTLKDFEQEMS